MFLAGLKFALGFAAGMFLLLPISLLVLIAIDRLAQRRKKRRDSLCAARPAAKPHIAPQIRVVLRFAYRTEDWIGARGETKYLR